MIRALTEIPFDSGLFRGLNRLMVGLRVKPLPESLRCLGGLYA